MPERPVYMASDSHLGAAPPEMEAAFLRWLEFAGGSAGLIFLNGDLFDFWFEWGSTVPPGHDRVLRLLREISSSGVPVHLMGGNHDWWGGRYLTDEIGVTFHRQPVEMLLAGKRALVAHGDGLGQGDLAYRTMRGVLRSRLACWGFRQLPPRLGIRIAHRVSRTSLRTAHPDEVHVERSRLLERWARDRLNEDESRELVLLGHTHLPRRVEIAPGRFYLNSGDWLHHRSYLLLRVGSPPLLEQWER
jgi:UDP-2,3-diacylglucosamine hydrolase